MTECLILGQSGVGKTSLMAELRRRNCLAYDADRVPGLGDWFDADGQPCVYNGDPSWRAAHRYLWDMAIVRQLVDAPHPNQTMYLAGTAQNDLQAVPLFTHKIALDASVDAYCTRLLAEDRVNVYPVNNTAKHVDTYRAWLTEMLPGLRLAWQAIGFTVLNTTDLSISEVADEVTAIVEAA